MNKYLHFDDLHDFWNYAMQESQSRRKESRSRNSADWAGTATWEEAKRLALHGWKEGMEQIEKYRTIFTPIITDKVVRPIPTNSNCGFSVDVGSYLANNPECFFSREYEQRNYPGRLFTIVVSCSFSAAIKPEVIIQRGAMICALVDAIEYAGHRVEVICNEATTSRGRREEVDVVVKKHEQALEMTDLAFCLAHPAMLRRIMFSVSELTGWADFAYCYGTPAPASHKGDLYVGEIHSGKVSNDKAIAWLIEKMKQFGIEFEQD